MLTHYMLWAWFFVHDFIQVQEQILISVLSTSLKQWSNRDPDSNNIQDMTKRTLQFHDIMKNLDVDAGSIPGGFSVPDFK